MAGSESFFDALKSKRESQNIEISEICEFTKIHPRYIEAFERGDFTVLPNVYIRLFLRSYANFIGSDSAKALKDYELYDVGKITQSEEVNSKDEDVTRSSLPRIETEMDSDPQISPKQIASGIGVIFTILILLWWASRVTEEQTENIESNAPKAEVTAGSSPNTENKVSKPESNISALRSKSNTDQTMIQKTDMQLVSLPNKLPLNDNDFLHEKKAHEITQIVNLSPPYTISITTLQETKLNISKIENTKIIELINKSVPSGQEYFFEFASVLNFEFWSSIQIRVKLNTTSIDQFITNGDMAIRGSYEAEKSQLYLSFYRR